MRLRERLSLRYWPRRASCSPAFTGRSRFRNCIDAVETVDFDAATACLEELTEVDLPLAADYRDNGYYELANLAYSADDGARAQLYLESINDTASFDDLETMAEEIRLLSIYLEAQAITVTNYDTKTALQALIDQLPEDYRDVAELKQRIVNFDAAIAAAAAANQNQNNGKLITVNGKQITAKDWILGNY